LEDKGECIVVFTTKGQHHFVRDMDMASVRSLVVQPSLPTQHPVKQKQQEKTHALRKGIASIPTIPAPSRRRGDISQG
jgi:hypothetical protein